MGHKISPTSFRVGIQKDWSSRWFGTAKYIPLLKDDVAVRAYLDKKLKSMSVDRVEIERGTDLLNVIIFSSRPGLLIGRGGSGIEDLKKALVKLLKKKVSIRIEIQEVKTPEASASIMAESIIDQIEKRIPFRRVMKQTLFKIMSSRGVKGAKIQMGGRLDGAEIARMEHLEEGSLPLSSLRAEIDYSKKTAHTTYGTIGVKVWIYKGLNFDNK
jgi:small subunit ribosomal protein S3